jgi:hypothetical protein
MLYGRLRVLFFLLFVGSFFAVAGSVLFYAFGYRFNFERGIFIYTGSITIKSSPEEVSIKLDGKTLLAGQVGKINNTLHVGGLPPGEYQLEVGAPGFQSWSKRVAVHSGVSTEFWNILLPRTEYERTTYAGSEGTFRLFPSPKANLFALLREHDGRQIVSLLDTDTGSVNDIFTAENLRFPQSDTDNAEWSPNADRIAVPFDTDGQSRRIMLLDIVTGENTDITPAFGDTPPFGVRWNPAVSNSLLALTDTVLIRLDLPETFGSAPVFAPPIPLASDTVRYDISQEDIYFLDLRHVIHRFTADETAPQPEAIATLTESIGNETARSIIVYDEDRAVIITRNGNLFLFDRENERAAEGRYLGSGVTRAQFSDDGKKLLYSGDHEVSVAYLQEWDVQPVREAGTSQQIIRYADPISRSQWTKDYEHVLFQQNGALRIAELDHRDRRNIAPVLALAGLPGDIVSRLGEDRIFVAAPPTEGDTPMLFAITFPESTTLFGALR